MATVEGPLTSEATPLEEPEQPTPPKSYAEVVQEEVPAGSRNSTLETAGTNGITSESQANGASPAQRPGEKGTAGVGRSENRPHGEETGQKNGHLVWNLTVSLLPESRI